MVQIVLPAKMVMEKEIVGIGIIKRSNGLKSIFARPAILTNVLNAHIVITALNVQKDMN